MRHATHSAPIVGALALAAALLTATTAWSSSLGHPYKFVLVGTIEPPFQFGWNLGTAVGQWPPLSNVYELQENGADIMEVDHLYSLATPTLFNRGIAHSDASGVYSTQASMWDYGAADPNHSDRYMGVFAYSQWSQTFRKESSTAYFRFHISHARIQVRSVAVDSARAELALRGQASGHGHIYDTFSEQAGVVGWTATGRPPTLFDSVVNGPMPAPMESDPSMVGHALVFEFDPYTHDMDISQVAIGDTFNVSFFAMSQAVVSWGEFPGAASLFRDPATGEGIQFEVDGLTPIDGLLPTTAVAQSLPAPASLSSPWPNPARGAVELAVDLSTGGNLDVGIFDLSGRCVATLASGYSPAGRQVLRWGSGTTGVAAPAGVYFVRAIGPGLSATRRVVLLGER